MEHDEHLSGIETCWTDVALAHGDAIAAARDAQSRLLRRYERAARRYLAAALRDDDAAEELYQTFALRLVRGDFRNADPSRGRFRQLIKTTLYHLVIDHRRTLGRGPRPLGDDAPEPAVFDALPEEADRELVAIWRRELLDRAWEGLAKVERDTGQYFYTLLRFRSEHPEVRSATIAERFGPRLGRPINADWVRKRVFLAREKLGDLLLDEVARSIGRPTDDELEEELLELDLHAYCRGSLGRRRRRT
jgi:RNA polymerase sigma-70 factor (ECF subfamily)